MVAVHQRLHLTLLLVLQDGQLQGVFAEVKYLHRADGRLTRRAWPFAL